MATASTALPPVAGPSSRLLTADEYGRLASTTRTELVRGKVIGLNIPRPRHGLICRNVIRLVDGFVHRNDLGYVFPNDTGFVTRRDPDSVRGPDVSFYSYARIPKGRVPDRYAEVAPELAFEVLSPTDRWRDVLEKVVEYLDAGVTAVCVLDPQRETATVNPIDEAGRVFRRDESLTFPDVLPGFTATVAEFFAE